MKKLDNGVLELGDDIEVSKKHCRSAQGEKCCAYLVRAPSGFKCVRGNKAANDIKSRLDAGTMVAKGQGDWKECLYEPRLVVEEFAETMEQVLREHDEEKGFDGWRGDNSSVRYLLECLKREVEEMLAAFDDCNPVNLGREAVDVANFAMMICDRVGFTGKDVDDD